VILELIPAHQKCRPHGHGLFVDRRHRDS